MRGSGEGRTWATQQGGGGGINEFVTWLGEQDIVHVLFYGIGEGGGTG